MAANDQAIMNACSLGNLELNQFLPLVADCLLTNLDLAHNACRIFQSLCVNGITANEERCRQSVDTATASVTAFVGLLGYETAEIVARTAQEENKSIKQVVMEKGLLSEEQCEKALAPETVTRLGGS